MNASSYQQSLQKVLFHDAILMQLAARFSGAVVGGPAEDADAELEMADDDQDDDLGLAGPGNDPGLLAARDAFRAALARERQLMGEVRELIATRRKPGKHDDRRLRPSRLMMMQLEIAAPVFN